MPPLYMTLRRPPTGEAWASFALLVVVVVAWEWLPVLLHIPPQILPPASESLNELFLLAAHGQLHFHLAVTVMEIALGAGIGVLVGLGLGYLLGRIAAVNGVLSPYIVVLQVAPKVALAPLFVLWLGPKPSVRILVAALVMSFPVMVNLLTALRGVHPAAQRARNAGAVGWGAFRNVELPAIILPVFAGLRIGTTLATAGVIGAEYVGGTMGLGYLLTAAAATDNTAMAIALVILVTAIALAGYLLIVVFERLVLAYIPPPLPDPLG